MNFYDHPHQGEQYEQNLDELYPAQYQHDLLENEQIHHEMGGEIDNE